MIDKEKLVELILLCNMLERESIEGIVTKWLEQNQIKPIIVGLSDEQIYNLSHVLDKANKTFICESWYTEHIREWAKTQTFSTPTNAAIDVASYDKRINELVEENQRLERLTGSLHDSLHDLLEQLKTPLIKPKQKWMYKQNGDYYVVTDIQIIKGLSKFDDIWIEDQLLISYVAINDEPLSNAQVYTRPFIQFISKFEYIPVNSK